MRLVPYHAAVGLLKNLGLTLPLPVSASSAFFAQNCLWFCPKTAQQPAWLCASDPTALTFPGPAPARWGV